MTTSLVFMFSGQGSHYYHMGRELFEKQSLFRKEMQAADKIYQSLTSLSVIDELYNDKHKISDVFDRTTLTHPAIFMIEYALTQLLMDRGIVPNYVLGASLGEFAAAVQAGVLSFDTAFKAVITQAQILEEKCMPGRMLAILHTPDLYNNPILRENSELAAIHFHSHFVISGKPDNLIYIEEYLRKQQISCQVLAVTLGFHSSYIDAAALHYMKFMESQLLQVSSIPYISCTHATNLSILQPGDFWDCIRRPIQFQATIDMMEKKNNYIYIDVGPAGTLATFVKHHLANTSSQSKALALLTPFGQDIKNIDSLQNLLIRG